MTQKEKMLIRRIKIHLGQLVYSPKHAKIEEDIEDTALLIFEDSKRTLIQARDPKGHFLPK